MEHPWMRVVLSIHMLILYFLTLCHSFYLCVTLHILLILCVCSVVSSLLIIDYTHHIVFTSPSYISDISSVVHRFVYWSLFFFPSYSCNYVLMHQFDEYSSLTTPIASSLHHLLTLVISLLWRIGW